MDKVFESVSAPWVLVAGGFHYHGGMDKANAALARHLIERQTPVHLVAHRIDAELLKQAHVTAHIVPLPAGSFLLGEMYLGLRGRAAARRVTTKWPATRVLVNGGNCNWPDINWVHYVHHAAELYDQPAPLWFKIKNRISGSLARRREHSVISSARIVLANSERTRCDLIRHLNLDSSRVSTIYLGSDPSWKVATADERRAARAWLGKTDERPLVIFVGALGHDQRKGFDTLWSAWKELCGRSDWDADLVVAGGGRCVARWQREIEQSRCADRVRLLGFTERIRDLLAATDLLVSPVRYESYGLNVQEAICRGVPAMVSSCAGVAERYPPELAEMILPDAEDVADLVARLLRWRAKMDEWRQRFLPLAKRLRGYTWANMAQEIVALVEGKEGTAAQRACDAAFSPESASAEAPVLRFRSIN